MFVDVHCHPFDLHTIAPQADFKVLALSSAWNFQEFVFNEKITEYNGFGIHPQQETLKSTPSLETLNKLAAEKKLAAVGEFGFDLYSDELKETETWQDEYFAAQLEIALKHDLPIVLHVRRAMHKIFAYTEALKRCKFVIFHSWSGTLEEGQSLLRRGVNAYFSFGNTILNGHKQQIRCCSLLPADRLLTETDAPYQPKRNENFSSWKNLPIIVENIASLRNINSKEIENQFEKNFNFIFSQNLKNCAK